MSPFVYFSLFRVLLPVCALLGSVYLYTLGCFNNVVVGLHALPILNPSSVFILFRFTSGIRLEGLKKTTEIFRQASRYPDRDSYREVLKQKSEALLHESACSVKRQKPSVRTAISRDLCPVRDSFSSKHYFILLDQVESCYDLFRSDIKKFQARRPIQIRLPFETLLRFVHREEKLKLKLKFISNSSRSRYRSRNKFHKPLDIECVTYQNKCSKLIIWTSHGKHNIKYIYNTVIGHN
jgi:hypothetical protein